MKTNKPTVVYYTYMQDESAVKIFDQSGAQIREESICKLCTESWSARF
jgi:hypothetical protein